MDHPFHVNRVYENAHTRRLCETNLKKLTRVFAYFCEMRIRFSSCDNTMTQNKKRNCTPKQRIQIQVIKLMFQSLKALTSCRLHVIKNDRAIFPREVKI